MWKRLNSNQMCEFCYKEFVLIKRFHCIFKHIVCLYISIHMYIHTHSCVYSIYIYIYIYIYVRIREYAYIRCNNHRYHHYLIVISMILIYPIHTEKIGRFFTDMHMPMGSNEIVEKSLNIERHLQMMNSDIITISVIYR